MQTTASPDTPALAVSRLGHRFGSKVALHDVSFTLPVGSFTVLLGLNGAGKTTLFSLITRLYSSRHGSIRLFGHDIDRSPGQALATLGVVFQARTIDLDLTVGQNLHYHAALFGLSRREAGHRIAAELERAGLADREGDVLRKLSGGQLRRVEIARALLHRPRLLLLDEPTVGLDMASRQAMLGHIRRLKQETGLSVLFATHLFDEIQAEDTILLLHKGRLVAEGGVPTLIERSEQPDLPRAFDTLTRLAS
ncbi:ATP-binding cassette domain-containing protein [Marinivivus vitaminiproducens]|uniref:ATP-binding cassette domain-containing protein n=1 Tax=Marinivivus vitaminiproducens TaxID=3035935 RepID=UPI0027A5A894|nr:ATP-binding cassette domain-containing protein [Geminicoccaceae bacterium SCSIO 64248]